MRVVIVECDADGNVDLADLSARAEQYSNELAAIMITYPSTHGVFEETVIDVCDIVHRHGGQVYVDGANLNALVGLASPGKFGADVSAPEPAQDLLHSPRRAAAPVWGPIGVGAHLQPFLAVTPGGTGARPAGKQTTWCPQRPGAAPPSCRSAGPTLRSWAPRGLTQATRVAILSANYIAHRLKGHYPVLYTGRNGTVAHECIVDIRPLKEASGISEEDIAKRLVDFGFHAQTMVVPGRRHLDDRTD